jgi:hypothetical protein
LKDIQQEPVIAGFVLKDTRGKDLGGMGNLSFFCVLFDQKEGRRGMFESTSTAMSASLDRATKDMIGSVRGSAWAWVWPPMKPSGG